MCGKEAQKLNHKAYNEFGPLVNKRKASKKIIEAGVAYYNIFKEIDILLTR